MGGWGWSEFFFHSGSSCAESSFPLFWIEMSPLNKMGAARRLGEPKSASEMSVGVCLFSIVETEGSYRPRTKKSII